MLDAAMVERVYLARLALPPPSGVTSVRVPAPVLPPRRDPRPQTPRQGMDSKGSLFGA
jgi:hypothetical protein